MKKIIVSVLLTCTLCTFAQKKDKINLWPGKVPGEIEEKKPPDIDTTLNDNIFRYTEVNNPVIEIYLPQPSINNGAAVVICPGGGYKILAYDLEGTEIAAWLNKIGFTAFILQYRIPDKKEGALQDIQRAIRIVRDNSQKWNINPDKIGVMGFSAGGSLSARVSTLFNMKTYTPVDKSDSLSCKPSFSILIYPAYLDQGPNLTLSAELDLNKNISPVFIFQTADDPCGNSALVMAAALRDTKNPVELHFLSSGGHGYGLRSGNIAAETWPVLAENWLKSILKLK